jgi:uncharacterized protein with beta-barrel porin domain
MPAAAQDATWLLAPGSGDMTDGLNWSSGALPTGTATFGSSSITNLTLGASTVFGGWTFASDAPAYSIATGFGLFLFTGAGIVVNGAIPTLTNNGTIQFFNASSAGSANIVNNGALLFYDTASAGSATIANNYGMTLYGNSTLGSAAVTNANSSSSLYFYNNSSAGSAVITNNGTIQFNNDSSAGSATITNIYGSSSIYFRDTSTAGSAAITNNAFMYFRDTSTAGASTITNGYYMRFYDNSSAGSSVITSGHQLEFHNSSSAGSANITNNMYMYFVDNSSAGSATITNAHNSLGFYGSSTAGSATIINNSYGTVLFTNSSTAASATIINNGTLEIGGTSSAGSAVITNNLTTYFTGGGRAGSATITNNGYLAFFDDSSTGNATIISKGIVALSTNDQTGAATVTIQSGGALYGYGSIGNTTIESGGTFGPSQFYTLAVNGNLTLNSGSIYTFYPRYPGYAGSPSVSGLATLGGAKLQFYATSFQTEAHTVLTAAGGIIGTFSLDPQYGAIGSVLYGTNDVTITIAGFRTVPALSGAGSTNVRNVAAGIDRGIDASGGAPPSRFNNLIGYEGASLANALTGLTGEAAIGAQSTSFSTASTFLGIMLDPMAGARGATAAAPGSSLIEMADTGMTPAARVAAGWSVWTKAFGQAGRTASDAGTGAAGTAATVFGVAAGADRLVSPGTLVGFALAGGGTAFSLGGRGSGTGEYMQLGLYGSTRLGEGYLSAAISYGWNRFDVTRRAGFGPFETYNSAPVAHTFGGRVETGRRFGNRAFALTPYAAVEAIGYASGAYNETFRPPATGAFAIAYGARTTGTVRTELGLRVDGMRAVAPTADLLTFGRIAYAFQANTQRAADASFQQLANSGFTVFGARASTHTMLATLGTEVRLAAGTRATASLDGELGDRHRSIRANVGLSHSW